VKLLFENWRQYLKESTVPRYWHRIGRPNEFSEFTFNPIGGRGARMSGGRGTGVASGQYAFGEPGEGRIKVPAATKPFFIGTFDTAREFQKSAISLMRFAEAFDFYGKLHLYDDFGYAHETLHGVMFGLGLRAPGFSLKEGEWHVYQAIKDWSIHKQVHPMNILLARWGYNGIEYLGKAKSFANSGAYGNVRFPPINQEGQVVGLEPRSGTYMVSTEISPEYPVLTAPEFDPVGYQELQNNKFRPPESKEEEEEEDPYSAEELLKQVGTGDEDEEPEPVPDLGKDIDWSKLSKEEQVEELMKLLGSAMR
jgi:hypothetical protein